MALDTSSILAEIRNAGFTNPVATGIDKVMSGFGVPTLSSLTALVTAQAAAQSVPVPPALQIEAAQVAISNTFNKIQDLLGHTDRISGVDLSGNGTLATIAKTMESARGINGDKSCSTVLAAFGAITNATQIIDDTVATVEYIKSFLIDTIAKINNIESITNQYVNKITAQIIADVAALAKGQMDIIQHSVATALTGLIHDECAAQIMAAVMNQPLKNEVDKVATEILNKTKIAIKGYS
jgi:hypothetical protein